MENYKRFTDMSISIPDHIDHYHHRNRKDVKMILETTDTSIESNDCNENNSRKQNSLQSSAEQLNLVTLNNKLDHLQI